MISVTSIQRSILRAFSNIALSAAVVTIHLLLDLYTLPDDSLTLVTAMILQMPVATDRDDSSTYLLTVTGSAGETEPALADSFAVRAYN